ncbi:lysis protein [Pseudomonas reactans]|uniref:lysis system i-spanin subunit Rz n=1 Tax=Pseudomonas reactans TaxID=117680 RepID=UPI0015A11584|nr:lysis system i-spanin subunit Rz [Pseudomonas reactans]NWC85991.1 lysis protein [Pseudomonas reactans]NWD30575.1 lysis protein [Pseudomonas reactans]
MRFLVAIGVCVLVVVVWQVQAWRYGTQIERLSAVQTQKALHLQQAEQDRRLALEQQLSAIDQQHARELSDAQRTQAALRDRIASADVRLSVLLDAPSGCPMPAATATAAGSVVHAAPRARLDPAHAQRIIRITDDGDSALIALRACQAYVRAVAR